MRQKPPASTDKQTVFQTEWFEIESESFEDPQKGLQPYYRIKAPDGVVILPFTKEKKVVLIRQFRPAINKTTWEFPAGSIHSNENPLEAAQRELIEETGFSCASLQLIGCGRIMMDRFANRLHGFLGCDAEQIKSPDENIEVVTVTFAQLQKLVLDGEFEQIAALGLLLAAAWRFNLALDEM